MLQGLIGKKIGMTQIFDKEGNMIPVTLVETGPCTVLELKASPTKVTLGYAPRKEKTVKKPMAGYLKKLGVKPMQVIKEFKSSDNKDYQVGQEIKADFFKAGDFIDVSGTSIGKGFAGGMKRWNWKGGPGGHGSMHHRRIGSNGATTDPGRTIKGHNMPGHMGNRRITTQGLRVMNVDLENNMILVKGAVPGCKNSIVEIKRSFKKAWKDLEEQKVTVKKKVNPMKQSKAKAAPAKKK